MKSLSGDVAVLAVVCVVVSVRVAAQNNTLATPVGEPVMPLGFEKDLLKAYISVAEKLQLGGSGIINQLPLSALKCISCPCTIL